MRLYVYYYYCYFVGDGKKMKVMTANVTANFWVIKKAQMHVNVWQGCQRDCPMNGYRDRWFLFFYENSIVRYSKSLNISLVFH